MLRRWKTRFAVLALCAAGTTLNCGLLHAEEQKADGATYRLAYKFRPNQFVRYKVTHETTITTRYGEAKLVTENESSTRKHYRVVSVDGEGNGVLESVLDRVQMTAHSSDKEEPVRFDSSKGPEECPVQFRNILQTVGKPLARTTFAPDGELLSVVPLQSGARAQAAAGGPDGKDPSRNFLIVLPEDPVQVGDTWKEKIEVKVAVTRRLTKPVTLQRTYRLKSVENDRAVVSLQTSILTPVNEPRMLGRLIQRCPSGKIVFDIERGMIVSRTLNIDKTEIGCLGPKSSMHVLSRRREELVEDSAVAENEEAETSQK